MIQRSSQFRHQKLKQTIGPYKCAICGETDELFWSVDHIVPRSVWFNTHGNLDDWDVLSNWQWSCTKCNSKKGVGPDPNWDLTLYYDFPFNFERLLNSQIRLSVNPFIENGSVRDWFGNRMPSQLAGVPYLMIGATGTGKGVASFALPHSLNSMWKETFAHLGRKVPRIRKALFLTDSDAMRTQYPVKLKEDLEKYGLRSFSSSDVAVMTEGKQNCESFLSAPFIITTPQMIERMSGYDAENEFGQTRENFLNQFELIIVDEPHKRWSFTCDLARDASRAIVVGPTATPCDGQGKPLRGGVVLSVYTDEDAIRYDFNHKNLLTPPAEGAVDEYGFNFFIREISVDEAKVIRGRTLETYKADDDHRYQDKDKQLLPALYVARGVAQRLLTVDQAMESGVKTLSSHRPSDWIADLKYVSQGQVKFAYSRAAKLVQPIFQEWLTSVGLTGEKWQVDIVMSSSAEANVNNEYPSLTVDHPWAKGKQRIVFVIGQGREGFDTPPCLVEGLACSVNSPVEIAQRALGRTCRGIQDIEAKRCPTEIADVRQIITHSHYNNMPVIKDGIKLITEMREMIAEEFVDCEELIRRFEEVISGEQEDSPALTDSSPLTSEKKRKIISVVANLAGSISQDESPTVANVVDNCDGLKAEDVKADGVREFIEDVIDGKEGVVASVLTGHKRSQRKPDYRVANVELSSSVNLDVDETEVDIAMSTNPMIQKLKSSPAWTDGLEQTARRSIEEEIKNKRKNLYSDPEKRYRKMTEVKEEIMSDFFFRFGEFSDRGKIEREPDEHKRKSRMKAWRARFKTEVNRALSRSLDFRIGTSCNLNDPHTHTIFHEFRLNEPSLRRRLIDDIYLHVRSKGLLPGLDFVGEEGSDG